MFPTRSIALATTLSLSLLSAGCGSGVGNGAPRVSTVPVQATVGGGAVFSLDLGNFVSDPEGGPMAYTVVSGGGGFTGDMYSNTFGTLGTYTVQFSVTDVEGKTARGSFDVTVNTANLAVVAQGNDLQLLDTDTQSFLPVSGLGGFAEAVRATLPDGHVIYERAAGTQRLFVYNPNTRSTTTLGDSPVFDTVYVAHTVDGRVVFSRAAAATPADTDLYIWSSETGLITTISAQVGTPDGNAIPTSGSAANLVFFEAGAPANVYYFNPQTVTSTPVAGGGTDETLRGVLGNDAAVYTRLGGGGEQDLFYYTLSGGEVEVGADLGPVIETQTKTYRGTTSTNLVVFEVMGVTAIDLYVWDPGTGASTVVATNPVDDTFVAVTALDEVVFRTASGVGDDDLSIYTHGGGPAVRSIAGSGSNEVYVGQLTTGDVIYRVEAGPDELWHFATVGGGTTMLAGGGAAFDAVLMNDHVVYTTAAGVFVIDPAGGPASAVAGAGSVFGGEVTGGDFVVEALVSAQFDLVLWDESAVGAVTISSVTGNDTFGAGLANGDVLFLRVEAPKTTSDLYLWRAAGATTMQLTDGAVDHAVSTTFAADNS